MSGGGVPEGWTCVTLDDVGAWGSGGTPKAGTAEYYDGKIPWAIIGDLNDGLVSETARSITEEGLRSSSAKAIPSGTLLVAMYGSIGKLGITGKAMATNQAIAYCRTNEACDRDFLFHWLRHNRERLLNEGKGGAQQNISQAVLKAFPALLPPLPEQKRIVARLDALQARSRAAREALAEVPALLDTFRQSVLAAAFRGDLTAEWRAKNPDVEPASKLLERIRAERKARWEKANPKKKYVEPEPVDDSELPELPEGWAWARLEEVATDFDYGTAAKSADRGRVPVLRMGNLQGGEIDWTDLKYTDDSEEFEKYALEPNTVLFNRTNSPELVGKTAIYRGERPAVFAGYLIRVALLNGVAPDLVNLNLNSLRGRTWCWSVKSDGVSQSNISAGKLKDYAIPLCPLAEQVELVALVRAQLTVIDQMTKAARASTADLDTLDQSILARAFRGELVDQDPNDEPAEALLARIRTDGDNGLPRRGHRGPAKHGPGGTR